MNARSIYKSVYSYADKASERLHYSKTIAAEMVSVFNRRKMYTDVKWTDKQQEEFDNYWMQHYGKKFRNSWHKIYQSINGKFAVDYIPEMLFTTKVEKLLNDFHYASILSDKSLVEIFARDVGCHVPDTILVCSKGVYFDHNRRAVSLKEASQIMKESKETTVLKPTIDSGSGRSVQFLSDEQRDNIKKTLLSMGTDFIVQKAIQQHPIFASLNSSSVNTLRVMTYILKDEIHHVPLACRMGNGNSKVDNIHAGGLVVGVKDDGALLPTAYHLGYGDDNKCFEQHPTSNIIFEKITLPSIDKVLEVAYALHGRLPRLGIISWDFTVDESGNPVFIEANLINQSIWFPQIVHGKGGFGDNTPLLLEMLQRKGRG